jgi:hypothetical protein
MGDRHVRALKKQEIVDDLIALLIARFLLGPIGLVVVSRVESELSHVIDKLLLKQVVVDGSVQVLKKQEIVDDLIALLIARFLLGPIGLVVVSRVESELSHVIDKLLLKQVVVDGSVQVLKKQEIVDDLIALLIARFLLGPIGLVVVSRVESGLSHVIDKLSLKQVVVDRSVQGLKKNEIVNDLIAQLTARFLHGPIGLIVVSRVELGLSHVIDKLSRNQLIVEVNARISERQENVQSVGVQLIVQFHYGVTFLTVMSHVEKVFGFVPDLFSLKQAMVANPAQN